MPSNVSPDLVAQQPSVHLTALPRGSSQHETRKAVNVTARVDFAYANRFVGSSVIVHLDDIRV